METINRYAPPVAAVENVPADGPALWNPNAAACWCLLFTPIFGAWLHLRNWQALGEARRAASARLWLEVSVFVVVGTSLVSLLPQIRRYALLSSPIDLALLLAWYFREAKPQARHVADRFGSDYPRKGWGAPIVWAILAFVGYRLAVGVVLYVALQFTLQSR